MCSWYTVSFSEVTQIRPQTMRLFLLSSSLSDSLLSFPRNTWIEFIWTNYTNISRHFPALNILFFVFFYLFYTFLVIKDISGNIILLPICFALFEKRRLIGCWHEYSTSVNQTQFSFKPHKIKQNDRVQLYILCVFSLEIRIILYMNSSLMSLLIGLINSRQV